MGILRPFLSWTESAEPLQGGKTCGGSGDLRLGSLLQWHLHKPLRGVPGEHVG